MRQVVGFFVVLILKVLGRLPLWIPLALGTTLLPFYIPFRRRTRARLRQLSTIDLRVAPLPYYRMRLRLALLSLKHLLGLPDGCTVTIEGQEHYDAALASGKPVVILGWHQGPVELLHRIPQSDPKAVGRLAFLMTAKAFSPALTELMKSGRAGIGKEILHPQSLAGLRRWEKEKGLLAMMIDQVPGEPEESMSLFKDKVSIPYPGKLLEWIAGRNPSIVTVSVRWEKGNCIVFRYSPVDSGNPKEDITQFMESCLRATPNPYNWSYPKIRVLD